MLAARTKMVAKMRNKYPDMDERTIMSKLVAYTSDQV